MIKNPSGRMVPYNSNMKLPNPSLPTKPPRSIQRPPYSNTPYKTQNAPNKNVLNKNMPNKNAPNKNVPTQNFLNKIYNMQQPQYITAVVVQKRNIYMESQNITDSDVYEIVSFYNSHKNGACAYTDYKPVNTDKWRIVAKYFKKLQYNVPFNIETSETIEKLEF